jgi:hypothetical protein
MWSLFKIFVLADIPWLMVSAPYLSYILVPYIHCLRVGDPVYSTHLWLMVSVPLSYIGSYRIY